MQLEETFDIVANYAAIGIEFGAVLIVTFGAVQALLGVFGAFFAGDASGIRGRAIWLKFATWILLALEFALAADIVRTAVAPTWDDIWKLAVIAVVRTMLNYFLARDIADFTKLEANQGGKSKDGPGTGPAAP